MEEALLDYLERLLGERVDLADTISVSSTQRARIAAWLSDHGVPTDFARLGTNRIKVAQLLNGGDTANSDTKDSVTAKARPTGPMNVGVAWPSKGMPGPSGLGIDIQARASMPEATDFRSDKFFGTNFSPSEIAHCIQQIDPLESFAGLWAAKEAIMKAGAGKADTKAGLRTIEITYDAAGAPTYPGCLLSISHDHGVAVAVCIRLG